MKTKFDRLTGLPVRASILTVMALTLFAFVSAQEPDRSKPPQVGLPPALRLAPIEHLRLSNGLNVLVLEKHNVPVLQVDLMVKTGSVMDPQGKKGLATLTATMLMDGAGSRDALQLADAIDYLGAHIDASAGYHTTTITLSTPVARLDSALALYADVVRRPTFPSAELERERNERLTVLLQWRDQPRALASVMFNRALFGSAHPYGIPTLGDEHSLRSFSAEDLHSFYNTYFQPGNAALVVVGDVTLESIRQKLESVFGSWKGGTVKLPEIGPANQVGRREI